MEIKDLEIKFKSFVDSLKTELQSIRGNRPSPHMVEDVKVDYYGQILPIKALGSISVVPPREIVISVWDRGAVNAVAKAIETFLKVTANIDGGLVRFSQPPLTDERKKELEKFAKKISEDTRIKVRGLRDEINKEIKTKEENKEFSEDAAFRKKHEVQKIVDSINEEINNLLENKIKDILS